MNKHQREQLRRLMLAYGLSNQEATGILTYMDKTILNESVYGLVTRLKNLRNIVKVWIHNHENPAEAKEIEWYWFSHNDSGIKGPLKPIFRILKKNVQMGLSLTMMYTIFKHDDLSRHQWKKFQEALETVDGSDTVEEDKNFSDCVNSLGELPSSKFSRVSSWSERDKGTTSVRKRFVFENVERYDEYEEVSELYAVKISIESVKDSFSHPLVDRYIQHEATKVPQEYNVLHNSAQVLQPGREIANYAGRIGFIQEPGLKLRTVAVPLAAFQLLLSRMGNSLYDLLKTIPEDATFDQDRAVLDVQTEIKSNRKLMAIDLSSATDRFPLRFTLSVLRELGVSDVDINLFHDVSKMDWLLPANALNKRKSIKWETGQPLGLYPSFAAFALSHHVLVRMVNPRFYRVLGDDMIIDYESGLKLRALYSRLGLKISDDKTFESDVLGEFAGRLVTHNRVLVQSKVNETSDRSFLDLARAMGPSVMGVLKPKQRHIVKLLAEVPSDVCSYGLDWNPHGKTYERRIFENLDIIKVLESEEFFTVSSPVIRELKDTKLNMIVNHDLEWPLSTPFLPETGPQMADLELAVLSNANVHTVDITADQDLSSWEEHFIQFGDPRGPSTLDVIISRFRKGQLNYLNR